MNPLPLPLPPVSSIVSPPVDAKEAAGDPITINDDEFAEPPQLAKAVAVAVKVPAVAIETSAVPLVFGAVIVTGTVVNAPLDTFAVAVLAGAALSVTVAVAVSPRLYDGPPD